MNKILQAVDHHIYLILYTIPPVILYFVERKYLTEGFLRRPYTLWYFWEDHIPYVLNLQLCLRYVVKIIKNNLRVLHRNLHMYRRYYFPLTGESLAPKHCNAKFELMIWSFIQHGCIIELVKKLRFKIWSIVLDKQWHLMVCVHA